MIGLYESILDDELSVMSRGDKAGYLMLTKAWLKTLNIDIEFMHASITELNDGFALYPNPADKRLMSALIDVTFPSLADYARFVEECQMIKFENGNSQEVRLRFNFAGDIDISQWPTTIGSDMRLGIYLNAESGPYTLHNISNKKLDGFRTLKVHGANQANVTFKNFDWDGYSVTFSSIIFRNTPKMNLGGSKLHCVGCMVEKNTYSAVRDTVLRDVIQIDGNSDNTPKFEAKPRGVIQLKGSTSYSIHYPFAIGHPLKEMGITKLQGAKQTDIRYIRPEDVELVDGCSKVMIATADGNVIFDNYAKKSQIKQYLITNNAGTVLRNMEFKAWCDKSTDKKTYVKFPSDIEFASYLSFLQSINKGALDKVYSNCQAIKLEQNSTLVGFLETDIRKGIKSYLGKAYSLREVMTNGMDVYIPQEMLEGSFPFANFPELEYIVWGISRNMKGLQKTDKGWHVMILY